MDGGQGGRGGQTWQLRPAKSPDPSYIFGNLYETRPYPDDLQLTKVFSVAVSPFDFPNARDGSDFYIQINNSFVVTARVANNFPQGQISLSDPQRTWASISLMDTVNVTIYNPSEADGARWLGSMDAEIGFAGRKTTEVPFDQDELAQHFTKVDFPRPQHKIR